MITTLTVSNYRSLGQDVRIQLGRLTAFVGPNGSGKSNVVDALRFVADIAHLGLPGAVANRGGIKAIRRWSSGHPFNVSIRVEARWGSGAWGTYAFELRGDSGEEYAVKSEEIDVVGDDGKRHRLVIRDGGWEDRPDAFHPAVDPLNLVLPLIGGDARFSGLFQELANITVYAVFPDLLREPQKYSAVRPMLRRGENWASVLKDESSKAWRDELIAVLSRLSGDVDGVKVEQAAGFLVVRFRHRSDGSRAGKRGGKWFDAGQESDGTLRVAGIVTACLQEPPVPLLGVEEPELTVHPGAIPLLYDQLHQASGHSQVVLTTHSPELLDCLAPDNVRVVERVDGETRVYPMRSEQADVVRRGLLSLGEVLRSEGIQPQFAFLAAEG